MGAWHDWVMVTFVMNGNHVISQSIRVAKNTVLSLMNIHATFLAS